MIMTRHYICKESEEIIRDLETDHRKVKAEIKRLNAEIEKWKQKYSNLAIDYSLLEESSSKKSS
jgi:predicted nuclease with TOPRIM domain